MKHWLQLPKFLFALTLFVLAGCGTGSVSDHNLPTSDNVPTAKEEVVAWLNGLVETGEIDSGAEFVGEKVAKLKEEGVANADEIKTDIDELIKTNGSKAIKSKATAIIKKLK